MIKWKKREKEREREKKKIIISEETEKINQEEDIIKKDSAYLEGQEKIWKLNLKLFKTLKNVTHIFERELFQKAIPNLCHVMSHIQNLFFKFRNLMCSTYQLQKWSSWLKSLFNELPLQTFFSVQL